MPGRIDGDTRRVTGTRNPVGGDTSETWANHRRSDTSGVTPGGIRPPLSKRNRRPFPRVGWPCGGHPGPPRSGGCPTHPRTGVYDVARQLDCAGACGAARSDPVVRRDAPRLTQAGGEHGRRPRCEPVSRGPGGTGSITARGDSNERSLAVHYPRQASCRLRGCARPVRLHLSRARDSCHAPARYDQVLAGRRLLVGTNDAAPPGVG